MRFFITLFCVFAGFSVIAQKQDLYDAKTITEVKIYFKESNWDHILDSLKQAGNDDRLIGDVTINGVKYPQSGIRYKGNSSYFSVRKAAHAKLPFNIKVTEVNKSQLLPGGYNTLKLSNVFRDPSFLREILSYEIAGKYMPSPRANFAKIYVNDQYLGIYHSAESVDHHFLDKFYGGHQGVLVKCDPDWTTEQVPGCPDSDKSSLMYIGEDSTCYMRFYEMKDKNGWKDFIRLTKVLNQQPDAIESVLDVDQTLWMLAFNNVLVNLDSYTGMLCHNFYLYKDTTGVYHPIIWDMNLSLGGFQYLSTTTPISSKEMQELSPFVHYKDNYAKRPLIVKLLSNDFYRKIYMAHLRTILDENFANGAYLKRAQELQKFIDKQVQNDPQKLYTYEDFQQNLTKSIELDKVNIIGIEELMSKRTEYLLGHPLFQKEAPKISDVKHTIADKQVHISTVVENAQKTWLFYRYQPHARFSKQEMAIASGNQFQAKIEHQKTVEYYIVAEGERIAKLSPERAAFEFYKVEPTAVAKNKAK